MGNHHFPALARTALAEALAESAPGPELRYTAYGSGAEKLLILRLKLHVTPHREEKLCQ